MVCLNDWFATAADMIGQSLPQGAAEDSVSLWPVLRGDTNAQVRKTLIHHSINGTFAIRQGPWKLIMGRDSGGWSEPKPNDRNNKTLAAVQLYNMRDEGAEFRNRQAEEPELVVQLTRQLMKEVANGSTPAVAAQP
jgi:arylsulfatase A-like enzyme